MNKRSILYVDLTIIIFSIIFILDSLLSIYLKNEIINEIESNAKFHYNVEIRRFHLGLIRGRLNAVDFSFVGKDGKSSSIKSSLINFEHVDVWNLFFHKKIEIGSINLKNTSITIKSENNERDTSKLNNDTTSFSIYDLFRKKYKSIDVGLINIENPEIKFYKNKNDSSLVMSTTKGQIRIVNFKVDANIALQQDKNFYADSLNIYLKDIKHILEDSLYTLFIPNLLLSYSENKIFIDSLRLTPNYSKKDFSWHVGRQSDRYTIFAKYILFDHIDVKRLIENFECKASEIDLDSMHVSVFRNKYVPRKEKINKFIQELIGKIEIPLDIQKLNVKNSFVEYEELLPESGKSGKIFFAGINGAFENITNFDTSRNEVMHFHATSGLNMNSPFTTSINFPMNKLAFNGTCSLRNLEMKELNSMMESSVGAVATNGIIDSMKFIFQADTEICKGNLEMIYHDFRIAAKDVEKNDTSKVSLRIKTFIANKFIIKNCNPEKGKPIRRVEVEKPYERDKFIIKNVWETNMIAIREVIR